MAEQSQIKELVRKMKEERGRLLALLESLPEEEAGRELKPGEWKSRQQMSHMCEMETTYRAWVERALREDCPDLDGVFGERPAIPLEEADSHTLTEHLAEMRRQRQITMELVKSIKPGELERTARNSIFGELTVLQWLRSYYRHDRMHYDQLRGEEPAYRPRYAGGSEPDQRRPRAPSA